jgi:hypothetical protein
VRERGKGRRRDEIPDQIPANKFPILLEQIPAILLKVVSME